MANIRDVIISIDHLSSKIDKLENRFTDLINRSTTATNELEAASAKIIADLSNKIESCSCNKEILDVISKISTMTNHAGKKTPSYAGLSRHVPIFYNKEQDDKNQKNQTPFILGPKK